MYTGAPSPFAFMVEDKVQTVKHGATVDPGDYIMDAPLEYPHIFEYKGQKYMLSGSYVAADGVYGDATFEAKSDIDIIYTYSAIAPYTLTVNYQNAETKEPIEKAYSMKYESQLGYIEVPYNVANFLEKKKAAFEGFTFETMEGDINKSWSEESADHIINMYFAEIKPVVEEPIVEEPVIEEPVMEEPIIEEEAEAEAPVDEIEEPTHKTRRAEKEEPVEETTSDETEEIAEEETPLSDFHEEEAEEVIAENDAPMAAFEVAETEEMDETEVPLVVNSPLTGDERHTAAWAGLSLVSLLGILFLGRKKRMTE
jgi:LPXTG-motif cell wall-anchored protein